MSVQDWSTDPNQNITIDGINIAELCPAGNMNNAVRHAMASVRVMYNGLPDTNSFVTKTGAVFLSTPQYSGRGGFLHNNSPANTSGRIFIQPIGGAAPAGMANGDWLAEY